MPRGKELSEQQIAQIEALQKAGHNISQISKIVGKSRKCVTNYLDSPSTYGINKRSGRPSSITDQQMRLLKREAKKGKSSAQQLVQSLELPVGKKRVQEILRKDEGIEWRRPKKGPSMTPEHIQKRLEWGRSKVGLGDRYWSNVIWSDEKKFNLDGPDGLSSYWHDLRNDVRIFSKRHSGGGSVMIWACFSSEVISPVVFIEGRQNSDKYITTLQNNLLPFIAQHHPHSSIFMQDGASIHRSVKTMEWLKNSSIEVLDWPAKSPDMNPIENLWGIVARQIYCNGRQFSTLENLIDAILEAWNAIPASTLASLVNSMPNRIAELLIQQGKQTRY